MSLTELFAVAGVTAWLFMSAFYVLSLIKRDASLVDIGWGAGFVLIAWVYRLRYADALPAGYDVILWLVTVWGLRLAAHIHLRKPAEEDWRYRDMRDRWAGQFWWRSYIQIFLLQGLLMVVISAPIIASAHPGARPADALWLWIGTAIWLIGFFFEAVGDWQLDRFIKVKRARANPADGPRFMTTGLWRYTRHPNYFGEVVLWWGLFIAHFGVSGNWWAIIGPLTVTFLLLKVSGVTMLEKKYDGVAEFEAYKSRTSAFFPLPPKH